MSLSNMKIKQKFSVQGEVGKGKTTNLCFMLFELRNLFPDLKIIDIEVSYDKENKANSIETVEVEYTFVQQPKWRFLQAETMFEEIRNVSVRRR